MMLRADSWYFIGLPGCSHEVLGVQRSRRKHVRSGPPCCPSGHAGSGGVLIVEGRDPHSHLMVQTHFVFAFL